MPKLPAIDADGRVQEPVAGDLVAQISERAELSAQSIEKVLRANAERCFRLAS